jgi:hypothetical protein
MIFASLGLVGSARADVSEPTVDLPPPPPPVLRLSQLPPSLTAPMDLVEDSPSEPPSSYRALTITVDAIAIAALLGSFATQGKEGPDNGLSVSLFAIGSLGGVYTVPILHATHGHGKRGVASWLVREGAVGAGVMFGLASASCKNEFEICGLNRVGPGATAGLIVASVIDAVFLSGETEQRPSVGPAGTTWSPSLAPTRGGGTLGLAAAF